MLVGRKYLHMQSAHEFMRTAFVDRIGYRTFKVVGFNKSGAASEQREMCWYGERAATARKWGVINPTIEQVENDTCADLMEFTRKVCQLLFNWQNTRSARAQLVNIS